MNLPSPWTLTPFENYEAPAVAVLFFHNAYEEGKQGGLEILQESVRTAGNGNLRLSPAPGQWQPIPRHTTRQVDVDGSLWVDGAYPLEEGELGYRVRLTPEPGRLRLSVDLPAPLPSNLDGQAGFNLELMPTNYYGQAYCLDETVGLFPRAYVSPKSGSGALPLACGRKLLAAPDAAGARLEIEALSGTLELVDGRGEADNGWFVVRSPIAAGQSGRVVEWLITPHIQMEWVRPPVVLFSQVGYHPAQAKVAAIELDRSVSQPGAARLVRWAKDGQAVVLERRLDLWGEYLCFNYARFDFSQVREAGLYCIEYEGARTEVFPIGADVYRHGVWQPTLEDYFPVQMCHMEVRQGTRLWHGLCHMDDALQAPLHTAHFDGYHQYEDTETAFQPYEHIPALNRGGWHDAGDYDLAAGSQASTTFILALARENFGVDSDQTSIHPTDLKVELHQPDGQPDILQQIAHGVENLLSGYRVAGHSFIGIIENNLKQYAFLGDGGVMTDNQVDARPGSDDRWAFTHRHSILEYQVARALAAASRTLTGWNPSLAQEALDWAERIWVYEQTHAPQVRPNCYVGGRVEIAEASAAVELFLTTYKPEYRQAVLQRTDLYCTNPRALAGQAARVLNLLDDAEFSRKVRVSALEYLQKVRGDAQRNPFGVPYSADAWRSDAPVWGVGWSLLSGAVELDHLRRAFPDLVEPDLAAAILGYILGCHPVSNASLVSGVGAHSLTEAYGTNRADWSFIPGGVVSGPALIRPNYPELLDPYPLQWMQKEYVMGGAATYLYTVLAVDAALRAG